MKTTPTDASVQAFLDRITDVSRRKDCETVLAMMRRATKSEPKIWGAGMVGFGSYHYKYDSGREGDWFLTGFSPRKGDLTLYVTPGLHRYKTLLEKLGRHTTGKSCLYLKTLADVDLNVLRTLIETSVRDMRAMAKR